MSVVLWIALALWSAVIIYVFVDIRRVIANNNRKIAKLIGREMPAITDRTVLINRIALAALLGVSDWALLRFGPGLI